MSLIIVFLFFSVSQPIESEEEITPPLESIKPEGMYDLQFVYAYFLLHVFLSPDC